ncbi:minor myo-inositol transporter IolF [Planctomycetales bacterium]|nr:minor myo-inositol transporter IolF [Planctomycetales bacterium]
MSQPSTWTKTIVASMTSYIDAGSIVAGAAGLALWQNYLGMSDSQVGLVAACSSNAMSAAVGALIGGKICDIYGRKFVYTYDLLFYMLGMLVIIFSSSFPVLLTGYIIVGLAVGADVVASWTLIAENAPAENRAKHCGTAQFMWALGPAVVLILSAILTFSLSVPEKDKQLKELTAQIQTMINQTTKEAGVLTPAVEIAGAKAPASLAQLETERNALSKELAEKYLVGNKIVFGHLIVIAFIVWLIRLRMPESEGWKKEQELLASGVVQKPKYRDLFLNPASLKGILFLIGVYTIWNLAAGTMGFFLPWIFKNAGGVSDTMSQALPVILFIASCFSTYFIFMSLADKYSRRVIYCVIACLYIVAWGLFFLPASMLGIPVFIAISLLMGINNGSGQQAFYQMWGSELFPARYRATAQGFMFFAARICLAVWSFFMPVIAGKYGMPTAAAFLVAFATISMLIGTIFCPNTAGKTLEQIEKERYGGK